LNGWIPSIPSSCCSTKGIKCNKQNRVVKLYVISYL
jgi:hypothetical protein